MTQARYQAELQVLTQFLGPNLFKFQEMGTPNAHVVMAARTNRKNVYTLYMELKAFPTSMPKVFVTRMLSDRAGNALDSPSGEMHTLTSEHGWTRLCHYGSESWTPEVSLYKIYVKCRLWLEMYELHLQTGRKISFYLNHQQ